MTATPQSASTSASQHPPAFQVSPQEKTDWAAVVLTSPLIWGGMLTLGFYTAIPYIPIQRELLIRYFCSHPLEYATATLFFMGIAILAVKALRLPQENSTFSRNPFRDPSLLAEPDIERRAHRIAEAVGHLPQPQSWLVRRYRDVCQYLSAHRSTENLEDHLKYLADLAADRLHDSFALIRTITWAVPILGFLGTVIGITMAIANVTPDQLDTSLSEVTGGLAVAFDTTALSLTLSLLLVFAAFVVERAEQQLLSRVELVGVRDMLAAFPAGHQAQHPFEKAEAKAAEQLLQRTEKLISWQTELWQNALESLRNQWVETAARQQAEFATSLKTGMGATLNDHAQQLAAVRTELLNGHKAVSQDTAKLVGELQKSVTAQQSASTREAAQLATQLQQQLSSLQNEQRAQTEKLLATIGSEVKGWQTDLKQATEAGTSQLKALHNQGEILLQILQQEGELTRLQQRLGENLDAVRAAGNFDETLHSLTAAVHLLTSRHQSRAA